MRRRGCTGIFSSHYFLYGSPFLSVITFNLPGEHPSPSKGEKRLFANRTPLNQFANHRFSFSAFDFLFKPPLCNSFPVHLLPITPIRSRSKFKQSEDLRRSEIVVPFHDFHDL